MIRLMETGTSGGEGQGNAHLIAPPNPLKITARSGWRGAKTSTLSASPANLMPSKTRWALMTSGDVRRLNHDQVRSAEAALPLAALCRALRSHTSGPRPEAAAGLAQEAEKQLTHINTPSNSRQNLQKEANRVEDGHRKAATWTLFLL